MESVDRSENWRWREGSSGTGPAVIFDIDGVLADAAGRQHYLDWGDWKSFFDSCAMTRSSKRLNDCSNYWTHR